MKYGSVGNKNARKHGLHGSPEYRAWRGMKDRCVNPDCKDYVNYGARGIRVCDEWLNSPLSFVDHVGKRPSAEHSIDRIDVNGHYEPGNVRWATNAEQQRNRRSTINVTIDGVTKCLTEWCREMDVDVTKVHHRITRGWPPEEALLTPSLAPGHRRQDV